MGITYRAAAISARDVFKIAKFVMKLKKTNFVTPAIPIIRCLLITKLKNKSVNFKIVMKKQQDFFKIYFIYQVAAKKENT